MKINDQSAMLFMLMAPKCMMHQFIGNKPSNVPLD